MVMILWLISIADFVQFGILKLGRFDCVNRLPCYPSYLWPWKLCLVSILVEMSSSLLPHWWVFLSTNVLPRGTPSLLPVASVPWGTLTYPRKKRWDSDSMSAPPITLTFFFSLHTIGLDGSERILLCEDSWCVLVWLECIKRVVYKRFYWIYSHVYLYV